MPIKAEIAYAIQSFLDYIYFDAVVNWKLLFRNSLIVSM